MKTRFAIAAAVLASWLQLAVAAPEEYRVRALSTQPGQPAGLHVHNAAGTATAGKLRLKSFLNHEYDLLETKGGPVVFSAEADPASAKAEESIFARADLPGKPGSYILVFAPGTKEAPGTKAVIVDSAAKAFPPGSVMVLNLSSVPVTIELEKKPFEFEPGEIEIIKNMPVGAGQSAGMKASCMRSGKKEAIASGIWPHPGGKRTLQVILENPSSGRIEIKGIRDVAKP